MITHIQQARGSQVCGQACVAMAAGVTLDKAIQVFGHERGTRTCDVLKGFKAFGIEAKTTRLKRWDDKEPPPPCALLHQLFHAKGQKFHGHWVLNWHGVVHDPEQAGPNLVDSGGRFVSYVELVPPVRIEAAGSRFLPV